MAKFNPLLAPKLPVIWSYGVAVLSVIAALAILLWMMTVFHSAAPSSLFLCAVMLSAWFGGILPGLLAFALSVLAFDYYFLPPIHSFGMESTEFPRLLIFALSALFVGSLSAAQRSATESLRRARDDLRGTSQELKKINDALQAENMARKRAEEKLRGQARLLDLTHDTVFMRDMNDVITYWNRGAEKLYGWTEKEAIGKVTHQLTRTIFPAPLAEINAELLRTSRWEGELIHTKRDGTQVQVASRWALQRDAQGRPAAILETNNDITERIRASEALREAQMKLAHVNRVTTMGLLTASIAHEVNQPVAAAITNAHAALRWLDAQPPDLEEAQQALGRIIKDSERASKVIGRIRAHIKDEPPRNDLLDINETIGEVIALTRSELLRNTVSLRTQLSKGLPLVPGDRIQLQQVILNLIVNAVEAMSEGSEETQELLIGTGTDASNGVLVAVRDSGPGLDPQSMGRLFDAFYTTKPSGMGMGLSICRSIIEVHGGRLWATANIPHGAVFQFTLPTHRETAS